MALVKPKTNEAPVEEKKVETPAPQPPVAEKTKEQQLAEPKVDQPVVPAAEAQQALATVSPHATANVTAFIKEQAEQGFEGLAIDSFSFDRIKLDDGEFLLGSDEESLGTEFDFRALKSRPIYVVRQSDDKDAESFYSYDPAGQTHTDGNSAKETLDKWKEQGYGDAEHPLDIRQYLEIFALMIGGKHDGEMVSLSIPPSSRTRFGGKAAEAQMRFGLGTGQVVFKASVGKKVGEGNTAFKPWSFSIVGPAEG